MAKTKILVTGSCGFIFSNFMRLAQIAQRDKHEYTFVGVDKITRTKAIKNIYEHRNQKFYLADVSDKHAIDRIFRLEKPKIVIHGAAESHVDDSISDAHPFIKSNVLGTQVIVDACIKYSINRLIYASTDEVYGQLNSELDKPWKEGSLLFPRNPYSASKAAGELIIKAAHETHGLNYNITRSCNNFGPRQQLKNLAPKVIKCIVDESPIPVYGQGAQIREWIHVSDNCRAVLDIIKGPPNEIYNVSAGYEISNIELVNMICNIIGKGHDLITFVEDRPGHDFRYAIDSSKLHDIGWSPTLKFRDALEHTCSWYLKNKWYLK